MNKIDNNANNIENVIKVIRDQTDGVPSDMVYVIEVVSKKFDEFTPELVLELQKYRYLQMLAFNDCGIKSLRNFPALERLIRLDMVFNEIHGEELVYLQFSNHLQTLMLGGNKIEKLDQLNSLVTLNKLFKLDLINNPIQKQPGYRNKVFELFPSLMVLDTLDKSGKDAYNTTNMVITASRVPNNLFDKTPIIPVIIPPSIQNPKIVTHQKVARITAPVTSGIKRIKAPVTSQMKPPKVITHQKVARLIAPVTSGVSRTRTSRAGLTFPVTRIKRHLHSIMINNRVSVTASIYMAAVIQYLTAELVEIAGNQAKSNKRARITPKMIKTAIEKDEEIQKLLNHVTISQQE